MQHTIKADSTHNQFTVTTEGEGTVEGIIAFLKDIIAHSQCKPGVRILLDHRKLRVDKIKMSGVERVSSFFKAIGSKLGAGKLALVMQRDIDFGIARAWEILTADDVDIQIEVFRSIDEARAWLMR